MRGFALTAAAASALLTACAGGGPAPATFDLVAPRVMTVTAPKPAAFQLVVNEPNSIRSLETDRILIKPTPEQIAYYKGAVWSDRLPRLLQARMIEAFQNAGLVRAVGSRAERLDADIELVTEVRAFEVQVQGEGASAHASLYVKLVEGKTGRVIASRAFESRTRTSPSDAAAMVASLNQAFDAVLREVIPWVAKHRPRMSA